jgi:hypothetical protein
MMVGSWPCKVSSEIHVNGRRVSEPVQKDKGKATILESEDVKDQKRTRMVLSKGHEVVGPGYSRLSGDAARVMDRGRESDNLNRVGRVHQEYSTDRRIDRVTQDSWCNWDGYSGQQIDWVTRESRGSRDGSSGQQTYWVTQVSQGNRDSNPKLGNSSRVNRVGNMEQKKEVPVSLLTWKAGLRKIQLT